MCYKLHLCMTEAWTFNCWTSLNKMKLNICCFLSANSMLKTVTKVLLCQYRVQKSANIHWPFFLKHGTDNMLQLHNPAQAMFSSFSRIWACPHWPLGTNYASHSWKYTLISNRRNRKVCLARWEREGYLERFYFSFCFQSLLTVWAVIVI